MTTSIGFPQQLFAAFQLYDVKINSAEFKDYLHNVHYFFGLLHKSSPHEVIIDRPKQQPEDTEAKPLRLIPFLTFIYGKTKGITITPITDDYSGAESALTIEGLALCAAMTSVQESFKEISLFDCIFPSFPYSAAVNLSQDTIHAVFPIKVADFADLMIKRKFADACVRYTSFSTFNGIDEYMLAVEEFYQLLKKEDYISVFQPRENQPFGLAAYLSLVYAEGHRIRPVFYNADHQIAEQTDTPLARQIEKISLAYAALV